MLEDSGRAARYRERAQVRSILEELKSPQMRRQIEELGEMCRQLEELAEAWERMADVIEDILPPANLN